MRAFLRLTLSVLVISVISSENTYSAGLLSGLANKAKTAALGVKNKAKSTANSVKNNLVESAANVKEGALNTAKNIKNNAKNTAENMKNKAVNAANNLQNQAEQKVADISEKGKQFVAAGESALDDAISIIGENPSDQEGEFSEEELMLDDQSEEANNVELDGLGLEESEVANLDELLLDTDSLNLDNADTMSVSSDAVSDSLEVVKEDTTSNFSPEVVNHVESLFPAIESVSAGLMLDLSGKGLNDEALAYIAMVKIPMLAEQKVEKITLNLSNNEATHEGFGMVLESLSSSPKLVSILDFSGNNIGDEGAMVIAEKCEKLVMLNSIILSNCGMSGDGVLGLFSAIASIKDGIFQRLDLSKNNIDPGYVSLILDQIKLFKEGTFEDGIDLTGLPREAIPQEVEIPDNVFF